MRVLLALLLILALAALPVGADPPALQPLLDQQRDLLPPVGDPGGEVLTLERCLQLAYDNHPILKSNRAKVTQARAQLGQAWALYEPQMGFTIERDWQLINGELQTVFDLVKETTMTLGTTWTVLDSGVRHTQVEAARYGVSTALYNLQSAWLTQYQDIQEAYVTVLQAQLNLAIQTGNLERAQLNQTVSDQFYTAGQKGMADVTSALSQVATARAAIAQAKNDERNARLALAQAVGVDRSVVEKARLEDILSQEPGQQDRSAALKLVDLNPALLSLDAQARNFELQAHIQTLGNKPTVSTSVGVGAQGLDLPNVPFFEVQLFLTIPFFTPGLDSAEELALATAEQLRHDRENVRLQLVQIMDSAFADLEAAQERTSASQDAVRAALANFQLASKRYTAGLTDLAELINARSFVLDAQGDLIEALTDRKIAEGELKAVTSEVFQGELSLPPDALAPQEPASPQPKETP